MLLSEKWFIPEEKSTNHFQDSEKDINSSIQTLLPKEIKYWALNIASSDNDQKKNPNADASVLGFFNLFWCYKTPVLVSHQI